MAFAEYQPWIETSDAMSSSPSPPEALVVTVLSPLPP
jgi:hypothetical protein